MKQLIAILTIVIANSAFAQQHNHRHNHRQDNVIPALILGTAVGIAIAQQNRPQPVYVPAPQPVYVPPRLPPGYPHYSPRIMSSHEPCHYIGQIVMIFDQWNQPMGYDSCRP
jgi:hypothetical protein